MWDQIPFPLAVGDFNNDGIQDFRGRRELLQQYAGGAPRRLGRDDPVGSPITVGIAPSAVTVGDFNQDGIPDLAVTNRGDNTVSLLVGNGTGGFEVDGSPLMVGGSPSAIATADFNGDANADLVVANFGNSTITVLLGDGTGNFTRTGASPIAVGAGPAALAVFDYNKDGKQDLAIANKSSNNITVLVGDGIGGFSAAAGSPFGAASGVGHGPDSLAAGDFNADGFTDLAVANFADGTISVLLNSGAGGGFARAFNSPYTVGTQPRSLAVADLDGDHRPDIAIANSSSTNVAILLNVFSGLNQTNTFDKIPNQIFGASPFAVSAESSSLRPVSLVSTSTKVCVVAANQVYVIGTGFCSIMASQAGNGGYRAATTVTNAFIVSAANPAGTLSPDAGSPFAVGTEPFFVAAGDFNGDGFPDFAVANNSDNTVTVLLGNGAGGFTAASGSPFAAGGNPISIVGGGL